MPTEQLPKSFHDDAVRDLAGTAGQLNEVLRMSGPDAVAQNVARVLAIGVRALAAIAPAIGSIADSLQAIARTQLVTNDRLSSIRERLGPMR